MMRHTLSLLLCLLMAHMACAYGQHLSYPDTIRVACVGNSITEGFGLKDKKTEAYPARLQQLLGDHYNVLNAGLSGHTLMQKTDRPYTAPTRTKRHPFHDALAFNPDIVTIKLGTNDSKTPYDSLLHADFVKDLNALVDSFEALPSRPYIYLCLPIPAVGEVWTIRDSVIELEILPRIRAVAQQRGLPVIDLYQPLKAFPELLQDKIHPTAGGAMIIAEEIARRIQIDLERGIIRFGALRDQAPKHTASAMRGGKNLLVPIIQHRITDFYANKKLMGLNQYDMRGNLTTANAGGANLKFDYVPGLVAKAVIEAAQTFSDTGYAKSWFYSVEDYANRCIDEVPTTGHSLDDLNATKMYFALYDLTDPETGAFRNIANPATHANARLAMERAIQGLRDVKEHYVITPEQSKECAGGWWHKGVYPNQMWCDGQYMGPALLAQLIHYGYTIDGEEEDWRTITRQFDITWHKLWDPEEQLLWHAFSADPTGEKASLWADPKTGRSQEYWGRACGWYFLALVDVLELMPEGIKMKPAQKSLRGLSTDCRERLLYYLNELAKGLARRQDAETGCWYQLLAHDGNYTVSEYQGKTFAPVSNYLESSASSIFTAGYLKSIRLGLLDKAQYGEMSERAMQGLLSQFLRQKDDGTWMLINDCASAGLGGASWGVRDGSAAYYLLGNDVTRITTYTEGKVYGAFILAATEYMRKN